MKFKAIILAASMAASIIPAHSRSLMILSPENISNNILAWAMPIQKRCSDQFLMRHTVFDLVWDIYELKAGGNIDDNDTAKSKYADRIKEIDDAFGKEWDCKSAYKAFGENGDVLRAVLYPRDLDRQLSNPF